MLAWRPDMPARPTRHRAVALAAALTVLTGPAAAAPAAADAPRPTTGDGALLAQAEPVAPAPAPAPPDPTATVPGPAADPAAPDATGAAPGQTPGPGGTTGPAPPAADGAVADATRTGAQDADTGTPAPLVALVVLAALLGLALLVWAVLRVVGVEPRWVVTTRHATAEAGWRTGAAWTDFADWLRTRRSPSAQ